MAGRSPQVATGDVLLEVGGVNVRGCGSEGLARAIPTQETPSLWKFLRVLDGSSSPTNESMRMAVVLRAHQDHAASTVPANWRGNRARKMIYAQLEQEAMLMERKMEEHTAAQRQAAGSAEGPHQPAAVAIQAHWRGFAARQRYWSQLELEADKLETEMRELAAEIHQGGSSKPLALAPSPGETVCTFSDDGSLGIGFGCQGVEGPVYITKIKDGSAAAREPALCPGLTLVAVQVDRALALAPSAFD
jgi:hypothetical protein